MDVRLADQILKKKLIYAVKRHPVIYKFDLPESKNHAKKILAWQAIANELKEDVNFLKTKWKNLRDTYKKCKQIQNAAGSTNHIKGKWARHLSFLDKPDSIQNNQTLAIKVEVTSESEEVENEQEATTISSDNMQNEHIEENSEIIETLDSHDVYVQNPKEFQHLEDNRNTRIVHNDDDKVEVRCDRADLLFLGFADTYKKLSHKAQVTTKFNIARVIMDAELSDLQDIEKDTEKNKKNKKRFIATHQENYQATDCSEFEKIQNEKNNNRVKVATAKNSTASLHRVTEQQIRIPFPYKQDALT